MNEHSNKCASRDEIYAAAKIVWQQLESSVIARGFILAYRISKKVISNGGSNTFLQQPEFHSSVLADFMDTHNGVKKRVNAVD